MVLILRILVSIVLLHRRVAVTAVSWAASHLSVVGSGTLIVHTVLSVVSTAVVEILIRPGLLSNTGAAVVRSVGTGRVVVLLAIVVAPVVATVLGRSHGLRQLLQRSRNFLTRK